MAKKSLWRVRLGKSEWERHTYARGETDSLDLLESVRRGQQIGALARTNDGNYCQVVGDFIAPLNKSKIESALARAETSEIIAPSRAVTKPAPPTVIIIKRRRIPSMA